MKAGYIYSLVIKVTLIKSELPVVQGRTTIFQSDNYLKNGEKQKSHFLFFDSEQVMDDLFRASLTRSA